MKKVILMLMVAIFLIGCGNKAPSITTNDIIEGFKSGGLEVGEISDLESKEFGQGRKEGKRILIPSLGDNSGGRLFIFEDENSLKAAKTYYDELGKGSPLFFSHTYANGLVLLQMNGEMKDDDFNKYTEVIESIMK